MQDVVYDLASLSEVSPRAYLNLSVENNAENTEPTHTVTKQSREYKSMFLKQSTYTDFLSWHQVKAPHLYAAEVPDKHCHLNSSISRLW